MIPTFLLNEDNTFVNDDESILDINPEGFINNGNLYNNLRSAIEWAISHDEDAIYCVCGSDFRYNFNIDSLNEIINDLASEGIYSFYVNAIYGSFIPINTDLLTISDISSITSFFLFVPIYESVLSLLDELEDNSEINFIKFIELLIPNAFLLLKNEILFVKSHKIHIISPFRNAVNYIEDYLNSVINQSFTNYQIILIDDCSIDDGKDKIPELPFIKKIINHERKFALQNILDVLVHEDFGDDDIICLVDADDMLSNKYVLDIINASYQQNSVLMSYGSMSFVGSLMKFGEQYSKEEYDKLRETNWKATHLRTFKYKVFKKLLNHDKNFNCLRNCKGEIFRMPYDMAILFPMMEMVGFDKIQFINTPTYKYRLHPDNDHHKNREEQYECEIQIRGKSKFNQVF